MNEQIRSIKHLRFIRNHEEHEKCVKNEGNMNFISTPVKFMSLITL